MHISRNKWYVRAFPSMSSNDAFGHKALPYYISQHINIMNFTIHEFPKYEYTTKQKPQINYTLVSNIKCQQNQFILPVENVISEYFEQQSLQYYRINDLRRMIEIALCQNQLSVLIDTIVKCYLRNSDSERLYQIFKILLAFGVTLEFIVKGISKKDQKIKLYGVIFSKTMFCFHHTVFRNELEQCFLDLGQDKAIWERIFLEFEETNLTILINNIKNLRIRSREFRQFMTRLFTEVLKSKTKQIQEMFETVLIDLQNDRDNRTNVEIIFEQFNQFTASYFKVVKAKYSLMIIKQQHRKILNLHQKFLNKIKLNEYFQVGNLYNLCLREWLNQNNNCLNLFSSCDFNDTDFKLQLLTHFATHLDNYKDFQWFLIKTYIINWPVIVLQNQNRFLTGYIQLIGVNYAAHIQQFFKDLASKREQIYDNVNLLTINTILYPKQWSQSKRQVIKHKQCRKILESLALYQQSQTKRFPQKSFSIVHHQIQILIDRLTVMTVNLEQLCCIVHLMLEGGTIKKQLIPQSMRDSRLYESFTSSSNDQISVNFGKNLNPYTEMYPCQIKQVKQSKTAEVPSYVIQGRIIKLLKRCKSLSLEQIHKSLFDIKSEMVNVMLQNLIKKDYVEAKEELYSYVP